MVKAIIFDMDGTLIDSDDLVLHIYQALVSIYPPDIPLSDISTHDLFAKSYVENIQRLYGTCQKKYLDLIFEEHGKKMVSYLKLFPGTERMLAYLSRLPLKLYVLTSELKDIAIRELKHLGIFHFFDRIITASDLKHQKPDPEGLRVLLDHGHMAPEECLFVGDQVTDAMAGRAASVKTAMMGHRPDNVRLFGDRFDMVFSSTQLLIDHVEAIHRIRTLQVKDHVIRILQLTDLHLMGEETDHRTYQGIRSMIRNTSPHLIVLTGDQTMSSDSVRLYHELVEFMEGFHIPWTLVFGNHDTDHGIDYIQLIDAMRDSQFLIFHAGPMSLGYGNFAIRMAGQDNQTRKLLIFMDTHVDQFYPIQGKLTWGYGSISSGQLDWYQEVIDQELKSKSLVFLHIPLPEYQAVSQEDRHVYFGEYLEKPSTPPMDAGFFKAMLDREHTEAVFAGHDHYNDYQFEHHGILLAYGRVSGHYDYGPKGFEKGARLITIDQDNHVHTHIILYKDIKENS